MESEAGRTLSVLEVVTTVLVLGAGGGGAATEVTVEMMVVPLTELVTTLLTMLV